MVLCRKEIASERKYLRAVGITWTHKRVRGGMMEALESISEKRRINTIYRKESSEDGFALI